MRLKRLQRSLSHRRRRPARGFPHRCGRAGRDLLLTCGCGRGLEEGGRGAERQTEDGGDGRMESSSKTTRA